MIYLHKILPLLFSPLICVIMLMLLGSIFRSKKISIIGIVILILCSLPIFSKKFITYLEKNYEPSKISDVETADAIVVLSGMLRQIKVGNSIKYEFNEKVDRIIAGIDLFKDKKAPIIILTRGRLPWSVGKPEGEYLKDFAMQYGIPSEKILLTESSQNTEQEAESIQKLFYKDNFKIILVTSAFHMSRAQKLFEKKNINVIPFPVDYINSEKEFTIMDLIPSVYALTDTSIFIREIIGRAYYNLKQ
jgi:uncharacterized SAM-binding protein YcdF (DUF218 family)